MTKSFFSQGMEYVLKFPSVSVSEASAFFAKGVEYDLYEGFHKAWFMEGFAAGKLLSPIPTPIKKHGKR